MAPAAKLAGMFGPEGAAAGGVFNGLNQGVQKLVPGSLVVLDERPDMYVYWAEYSLKGKDFTNEASADIAVNRLCVTLRSSRFSLSI